MPWTCGPKCPCWKDAKPEDTGNPGHYFDGECHHPNFGDDPDYANQGDECMWELAEWIERDGELQDEIADLQTEQTAIRALVAARKAEEAV